MHSLTLALLALAARLCAGNPVVWWASQPVGPNETCLVAGSALASVTSVELELVSDGAAPGIAASMTVAATPTADGQQVSFVVPAAWPLGLYRASFGGATNASVLTLNAPAATWTQGDAGDASTPGGWLRVFGQQLSFADGWPPARTPDAYALAEDALQQVRVVERIAYGRTQEPPPRHH